LLRAPGGDVVVASARDKGSVVRVFNFAAQKITEVEFDDAIVDWAIGEKLTATVYIAVAHDLGVVMLRVPELTPIADWKIERRIGSISFAKPFNHFLVCTRDGEIFVINVD
jgi:hypothetical protein